MAAKHPATAAEPTNLADDLLKGAAEIASFTGCTKRQAERQLEAGHLPAFKIGGRWHMRRSTFRQMVATLEAKAMQAA